MGNVRRRLLGALASVLRVGAGRARAVGRRRAGPVLLMGGLAVFVGFALGLRVEIIAVPVTQLTLLLPQLQCQLSHLFVPLLLLLLEPLDSLGLRFLVSFVCSGENFDQHHETLSHSRHSHCLLSKSCIFFFSLSRGLLIVGPPTVDFDNPT